MLTHRYGWLELSSPCFKRGKHLDFKDDPRYPVLANLLAICLKQKIA